MPLRGTGHVNGSSLEVAPDFGNSVIMFDVTDAFTETVYDKAGNVSNCGAFAGFTASALALSTIYPEALSVADRLMRPTAGGRRGFNFNGGAQTGGGRNPSLRFPDSRSDNKERTVFSVIKAAPLLLLVWVGSCSGPSHVILRFPSPAGGSGVTVTMSDSGTTVNVITATSGSTGSRMQWGLFGDGFRRVWLGWTSDGNRASMLTCSDEFGERIDRFTFTLRAEVDMEREQREFREADANLVESLTEFASTSSGASRFRDNNVFSWFCTGDGDRSFAKFSTVNTREFIIPPYVKKRTVER